MKRMLVLVLALILCFSFVVSAHEGNIKTAAATSNITMIVTNPSQDPRTSMNINFHANTGYTSCYVQYTTVDDTTWANAKTQTGSYVTYGANSSNPFYGKSAKKDDGSDWTQTTVLFLDYSVTLTGLTPATHYMYRISDGSSYTDTYKFKTAGAEEWSFVVTGDFHEYYKNYGSKRAANGTKGINAAISLASQVGAPAVEHIVGIGDIVAWGVDYGQWKNVYSQPWIKNYSFANAIGNHDDMDRSSNSSNKYNSICNNYPLNGYGSQMGTCFYYIYNNVLFIYINYLDTSATAEAWADSVVAANAGKYKFSVLVNHRPATNKYTGGTYSYFWNYWADFCDRNHIDLVLAGDHHVYMRSQPLYNGSKVTNYGVSNPNATVYMAADSADGERGSSTDVTSSFKSNIVATHYYRYEYSGSTSDISAMLIHVGKDTLTTRFVYYETSSSASHPSFKQGSVTGHSSFYYGDTSYVYPSDHGYTGNPGGEEDESGLPAAAKNYLLSANGGKYKYSTSVYPGGASYYSYDYYGDNSSQGGSYMSGKLNNGIYAADSNPGTSNTDWAAFFLSQGTPEVYFNLSESIYINNISVVYRNAPANFYGQAVLSGVGVGEVDGSYSATAAYTVSDIVFGGSNYKLTITFTQPVKAKYIRLMFAKPAEGTRLAICETEVWGDTKVPEVGKFELVEDSNYTLDEEYVTARTQLTDIATFKEQFACTVSIFDATGKELEDGGVVGTGCVVKKINSAGEVTNEVEVVIAGDLTGDGNINALDYISMRSLFKDEISLSNVYKLASDINADTMYNASDYIAIKNHCKGLQLIK